MDAHLVDSGLAAMLAGLRPGDWIAKRDRMGHLLEPFVAHQLVTLAGWTDPDIRFWSGCIPRVQAVFIS